MHSFRSRKPSKKRAPRVAITIGDPFGIGPEIVLKALASHRIRGLADFLIIGDGSALAAASKTAAARLKLGRDDLLCDLDFISKGKLEFGRPSGTSGRASLAYVDYALKLIREKRADCLVTAPVSKEAISLGGRKFKGHTEYIAGIFHTDKFAMMLVGGPLRVTLVTRHIPIKEVPEAITEKEILKSIELSHEALKVYFGIRSPKIGVASLNPHGGEGGSIGTEEKRIIGPALAKAKRRFSNLIGPVAAEALFNEAFKGNLDCIIAMYHDQGLTALKMIARDESVNVTLGLPFIRTSPGHGTAFDIAGKGVANSSSMIEAIIMAIEMYKKGA